MSLTFDDLRAANKARLPQFKNRHGKPAHSKPDGSDWCLAQWCNALTGEVGEAANLIKKVERGDLTLYEARPEIARELADIQTYLDILAFRADINLGEATINKFNEVSLRVGCNILLCDSDHWPTNLDKWQQYAAYCRSCAKSGEHDPHDFEAFVNRTIWER